MSQNTNTLTQEAQDAAMLALLDARCRVASSITQEAHHRMSIYAATEDANLATEGAQWTMDMAKAAFPNMDPSCPDMEAIKAHMAGELARRLYGTEVCITEELHRLMVAAPGLPAWTERPQAGGDLFYLAKAWAVAEVLSVDLPRFAAEVFAEEV